MVLALALGAVGLVGGLVKGIFGKKGADASAAAFAKNAQMSRENANIVRAGTALDMERLARAGAKAAGSISAGAGASGLKTSGSALDVLRESATQNALDRQLRGYQGALEARGYEQQAISQDAQAKGAKAEGKASLFGGILGGATSLLNAFDFEKIKV